MSAKALLSASVSAPPEVYVEDVFSTYLYTGNGSTQTITNGIDLSGEGGLVWIKQRSLANHHWLFDTARGVEKALASSLTNSESTQIGSVTSFGSSGFILGSGSAVNGTPETTASWTFRKAAKFFDVVTWTGDGSSPRQITHNLGSVPGVIIVKKTNDSGSWITYHRRLNGGTNPSQYFVALNLTSAEAASANPWNNTEPTSTVFTVGSTNNENAITYVAYLFAHDAGGFGTAGTDNVVSCGSYTGNGSASGPTVTLGWEPQWVLIKRSSGGTGDWLLSDNMRGMTVDSSYALLVPNTADEEVVYTDGRVRPNATGFRIGVTDADMNASGNTYIYIAIRRGPMRAPTSGTEVLESVAYTGDGSSNRTIGSSLTPDFVLWMDRDATSTAWSSHAQGIWDRIRGEDALLSTSNANQESPGWANLYFNLDQQVGWSNGTNSVYTNNSGTDYVTHHLRRAPGFFDVVAYTGTGFINLDVSHNLGVPPEIIITKRRDATSTTGWFTSSKYYYDTDLWDRNGKLNDGTIGLSGGGVYGPDANITATQFRIASNTGDLNASGGTYIAYLFASCPGVSKCGGYIGTGTTLNIDCGFTSGARFVLIKRADAAGDWYVWDTARGIISGDDPYLLLNSTAAEVTGTDYIDPLSSGFQISSTAPAAINASGGSFIFLAIA
jgi:hypothetical protein